MNELLIPLLFWLSIPLSLVCSVIGVWKDKYWLTFLGAFLNLPIAYYLDGAPKLHGFMIFLPFFQIGSAAAVREGKKRLAWLLLLPSIATVLWFLGVVMFYHTS